MLKELTDREIELIKLLCKGFDNRTIADRMMIGDQSVRNSLRTIYSKIGVNSRSAAIAKIYNHLLANHNLSINLLVNQLEDEYNEQNA
jgi:DNA-binding NarL/FixJ family response regulator